MLSIDLASQHVQCHYEKHGVRARPLLSQVRHTYSRLQPACVSKYPQFLLGSSSSNCCVVPEPISSGGFFAGKITSVNYVPEPGSRFDGSTGRIGTMYRQRYLKDGYFQALPLIKEVAVRITPPVHFYSISFLIYLFICIDIDRTNTVYDSQKSHCAGCNTIPPLRQVMESFSEQAAQRNLNRTVPTLRRAHYQMTSYKLLTRLIKLSDSMRRRIGVEGIARDVKRLLKQL